MYTYVHVNIHKQDMDDLIEQPIQKCRYEAINDYIA